MARILTEGVEFGISPAGSISNGQFSIVSDIKRSGVYAFKFYAWTYDDSSLSIPFTASNEIYVRFGFRTDKVSYTERGHYIDLRSSGTTIARLFLETNQQTFNVYIGTTKVGVCSVSLSANTWYFIEAHLKISDSDGIFDVKFNGNSVFQYSGDTKPSTQTTVNEIVFVSDLFISGNGNSSMWIDDIAINDTEGVEDNSWCGDGRVIFLRPKGAGDVTQLKASTGSNNWDMVNEIPLSTSDYVSGSVIEAYDLYTVDAFNVSAQTITRLRMVGYTANSVGDGGYVAYGLKTNGAEYWSGSVVQLTSYTISGTQDYTINPLTGNPWTQDEINAIQIGFKVKGAIGG